MSDEVHRQNTGTVPLAVFDLDGTLLTGDSLLPFLFSFCRRHRLRRRIPNLLCDLALYGGRLLSARATKERMLRRVLGGRSVEDVARHADWFCQQWVPNHVHPIGLRLLRHHQDKQHRVVLLSASPDCYVPRIASWFGVTEVICTRVAVANDRIVGSILGENCKGPEKVVRLKQYLAVETAPAASYGYADGKSDRPLLVWLRSGYWIGRPTGGGPYPLERVNEPKQV